MSKRFTIKIDFDFDPKFFAILPALNLNFHGSLSIEFEWLWFGVYTMKHKESEENIHSNALHPIPNALL